MKSKIILNILVVYFIITSILLALQLSSKQIEAVEPLPSEITAKDKLKNATVFGIYSPIAIINEKQFLIDENDEFVTPIINGGKVYIPVKLLKTAFNATIDFDKNAKQTIIRLKNKAIIFYDKSGRVEVIDNTNKDTVTISAAKIINDRFYIPLRAFAQIFEMEVFYDDGLIILSEMENIFDPIEEIETITELHSRIKNLPVVGNIENLKRLKHKYLQKENIKIIKSDDKNLINIPVPNKIMIKKTNNYNIYKSDKFIEVYFVDKYSKETFSFKVDKTFKNISDLQISNDRFLVTYQNDNNDSIQTIIYDVSNRENISIIKEFTSIGKFYKSFMTKDDAYVISKIYENDTIKNNSNFQNQINNNNKDMKKYLNNITYLPTLNDSNLTMVTYVDMMGESNEITQKIYLGIGQNIIVQDDNMYIINIDAKNNRTNLYLFNRNKYIKTIYLEGTANFVTTDDNEIILKFDYDTIYLDNKTLERRA